jgi:galactonate dehydratase
MIPDKPGFGIELDEEEIASRPYLPRNLRHYTGKLTDIRAKDDSVYYFKGLENAGPAG